jgi:hypothetical protein
MTRKKRELKKHAEYICFYGSESESESENKQPGVDLGFTNEQVSDFVLMWNEGISIENMAKRFKRPPLDVLLLMLSQVSEDKIELRRTGIFGL